MDRVNHDDTSVSPSTDINENDLDYVVILEISLRKRKLYTNHTSGEVGDNVSELSSEETVPTVSRSQPRRQPPDPFHNCELKTASEMKNVFDLMRPKNARITDHNDAPNVSVGSSNTTTKMKAGGYSIHSPAWK
ncbi:24171_t:CDS:2 [Gigaspora rosea]|nr:24171_t:CDS:2 [Gigaspora rosea]